MNFYPERKEVLVGYIEAVASIGLISGPLLGSLLYSLGGYTFTFYSFGGIFLLFSLFIKSIFPQDIDRVEPIKVDSSDSSDKVQEEIGCIKLL